jgi:excinuclease UvrABC ATPase subunit
LDTIAVRGARTHNLKDIDLNIPRDKLVIITGPFWLWKIVSGLRHALR